MSTVKATNFSHPSAANPAIVLDAAGGATVAGMGLVLVSPTSIANSGGSASASGGQVTFTGVSSVSLNGVFTSAYQNYRIIVNCVASSNQDLNVRFRISGTDTTATNYTYQTASVNGTVFTGASAASQSLSIVGIVATSFGLNILEIGDPNLSAPTVYRTFGVSSSGSILLKDAAGSYSAATAFDGCTFYPASGTFTGTIRVYGYKNS